MIALATSPETGVSRTVLPNGLTVLSEFVPGVRSVALGAWVRSGSMHEPTEQMGIAHLLEHMVFKGTEKYSAKALALSLEVLGGSLDAYTTREHTSYQARVLDEHIGEASDVLFELCFKPLLRDDDLRLERKVILEEIAMVDDTPDDVIFELHAGRMYPGHPYGHAILGTPATVKRLQVRDLRAWHERAYHPPQIVVAAAGNVTHEQLLVVLEQTGWATRERGVSEWLDAPSPPAEIARGFGHVKRKDIAQTHIVLACDAPKHSSPERHALSVASALLGGGMSSRLFQQVREELGLAYSVYSFYNTFLDDGQHGVYLATAPDQAREAYAVVCREMSAVANGAMTDAEIATGISQLKGQLVLSLEGVSSRLYRAAEVALYDEPYRPLDALLAELDVVTPAQVRAACAAYLDPAHCSVLSLGPVAAA
ncbi:MAG TPA: pitrilysin family protein [Gemmatimonadaceae bacterium]|nr:pitrilysin family protein [Gemmatimonadaceae bacterium]